jgi:hypothetical protein
MNKNEDEKIINEIKQGLAFIDTESTVTTPDIARFRRMIAQVEDKKQKKTKRETIIFVLVAAITISVETYASNQSILFFIAINCFAFSASIIGLVNWLIRGKGKGKGKGKVKVI